MTRKEFVSIALAANPEFNRMQRLAVRVASPLLVNVVNTRVDQEMDELANRLEDSKRISDPTK